MYICIYVYDCIATNAGVQRQKSQNEVEMAGFYLQPLKTWQVHWSLTEPSEVFKRCASISS